MWSEIRTFKLDAPLYTIFVKIKMNMGYYELPGYLSIEEDHQTLVELNKDHQNPVLSASVLAIGNSITSDKWHDAWDGIVCMSHFLRYAMDVENDLTALDDNLGIEVIDNESGARTEINKATNDD